MEMVFFWKGNFTNTIVGLQIQIQLLKNLTDRLRNLTAFLISPVLQSLHCRDRLIFIVPKPQMQGVTLPRPVVYMLLDNA